MSRTEAQRRYAQRHKERVKAARVAYSKSDKGRDARKKYYAAHKDRILKEHRDWRRANPEKRLLAQAKERAKKFGLAFDLTVEDVKIPEACPVFGTVLTMGEGQAHDLSPTLDRIDNTKGYVKGNVIVVSWLANRIKNDATIEQLKMVADFYGRLRK